MKLLTPPVHQHPTPTGKPIHEFLLASSDEYLAAKPLPNGWYAAVMKLSFFRARLVVGCQWIGYEDGW